MSSLFSSLTTSVGGMKAHARSLATVSSNLANTSTTGYKGYTTSFQDLVTDNSGHMGYSSSGVMSSVVSHNDKQGPIEQVDSSSSVAINGSGYFAVRTATPAAGGGLTFDSTISYTRAGDFTLDANGYLKNGAGSYLLGWTVDPLTGATSTGTPVPIQITEMMDLAIPTTRVEFDANLPASATDGATMAASTIDIYDSTGTKHTVTYNWTKVSTNADTSTWRLNMNVKDGLGTGVDYDAGMDYTFDSDGLLQEISVVGTGDYSVSADGTSLMCNLAFDGATPQTLTCDFSQLTQFVTGRMEISSFTQNGVPAGSYSSTSIDSRGFVSINYDNGQIATFYRIPVATFMAPDSLQSISGTAFLETADSGAVQYNAAGANGAGTLLTNSLEESTVDIANEFTIMIRAQQAYAANSKAIVTVDGMLKNLTTL